MEENLRTHLLTVCRTCLEGNEEDQNKYVKLFDTTSGLDLATDDILEELHSFKLGITKDDGLPQQICPNCQEAFFSINSFRKQCTNVQNKLAKWLLESDERASLDVVILETEEEDKDSGDKDAINRENSSEDCSQTIKESLECCYQVFEYDLHEEQAGEAEDSANIKCLSQDKTESKETTSDGNKSSEKDRLRQASIQENSNSPNINDLNLPKLADYIAEYTPDADNLFCCQCNKDFHTSQQLEFHIKECFSKIRVYPCSLCDRKFKNAIERNVHFKSHNEMDSHKCDICNQGFKSKTYVAKHKRAVHETRKHECAICDQIFTNTIKYNYHMRSHNPVKKYKCTYCERSFMQHHHLMNHERTHTGLRPFLCNICGKDFKQESNFKMHLRVHSGERPYMCNICGKDFIQRGSFLLHMRHHNNIRPYQCEICGKKFIQMSTLTVHLRTHSGEKPYRCDLCNKAFAQNHQLKYHKYSGHSESVTPADKTPPPERKLNTDSPTENSRLDNTEQAKLDPLLETSNNSSHDPYICPICSKGFKLPYSLMTHIKSHSEERNYVCKECGYAFKRSSHLRIHMNGVHLKEKPYSCDVCKKTFSRSGDRNVHMKSHSGDRPHQCKYCEKKFLLGKSLRIHERTHTGEKTFVCEICVIGFTSYNGLAVHTMKHSAEEKRLIKSKTLLKVKQSIRRIKGIESKNSSNEDDFSTRQNQEVDGTELVIDSENSRA